MKKKKNNNKWLIVLLIIFLLVVLFLLIRYSGDRRTVNTKLDLSEKKWIENNKKNVINVSIANSIPIFSENGSGIFFDFVNKLKDDTGLSFNLISYNSDEEVNENDIYFEVIKGDKANKLKDDEMIFYKDYYVLIGKNIDKIHEPYKINDKKIGVLNDDLSDVSFYISSDYNVNYTPYKTVNELKDALKDDSVDYIALPKTMYTSFVISNNYHIVYNITEMQEVYVLRTLKETDKKLLSIVRKSYNKYIINNLENKYNAYLYNVLTENNGVTEKESSDFLSKKYVFGYLENPPYSSTVNNRMIGFDESVISSFESLSKFSYETKKFKSVKDLTKALNNGSVDFASGYYNYSGLSGKYYKTVSLYDGKYVILKNKNNSDAIANSVKSLKGKNVISTNSILSKSIQKQASASVKTYDSVKSLLNSIDDESIIALDSNIYDLYKNTKLSDYNVLYSSKDGVSYGYTIKDNSANKTFIKLFESYLEYINYKQIDNLAWTSYSKSSKEINHTFLYIAGTIIIIILIWTFAKKKIKVKKTSKREETIRYVDPLTSLKNRNYLNKNFKAWSNNSIYPQAIIVINLNNLRHVNDVYGHEEGDKLIKLAANTLIRNQLDQSDIIRTDGNEYLIYLVGYEKSKVVTYMRKLYKELGELPYGYGATLGYSMIEDDIKTIDDAINEAVLEIRASKEMNNRGK